MNETRQTLPALVLVHGGSHAGDCWKPTIDELRRKAPQLQVLAIDLPGRHGDTAALTRATIAEWEASIVADVEAADLDDVVIVGHSMAGISVPGAVARLGHPRVREVIFLSAFVPRPGEAIVDTLGGVLGTFVRQVAKRHAVATLPKFLARLTFCNGMTPAQRRFTLERLHPESLRIATEAVDRQRFPAKIPRTWILTTRDRALSQASQHRSITALEGDVTVISLDACHDAMISRPRQLAMLLLQRLNQYS